MIDAGSRRGQNALGAHGGAPLGDECLRLDPAPRRVNCARCAYLAGGLSLRLMTIRVFPEGWRLIATGAFGFEPWPVLSAKGRTRSLIWCSGAGLASPPSGQTPR